MNRMVINEIYVKYFQKSKIFIYPLLNIKRGASIVPVETYFSWDNKYSPNDAKLICLYDNKEDEEYKNFVKNVLLKHARLCDHTIYYDQSVFVFDFQDMKDDWNYFKRGKYSKISLKVRNEILNFFEKNSGNYIYIHSYLFPETWFKRYAEILDVSETFLKEVGELCDVPSPQKEQFNLALDAKYHNSMDKKLTPVNIHTNQCDRCNGQGHIPKYNHISNGICFKCYGQKSVKTLVA